MPFQQTPDAEAIRSEILSLPVTFEPLPVPEERRLPERTLEVLAHLIETRFADMPLTVRTLKPLIREHPHDPSLKYHLCSAHLFHGNLRKHLQLLREIREEFPDYLFARTAIAYETTKEKNYAETLELLGGEPLSIRNLLPDRDLIHSTEINTFHTQAALLLVFTGHEKTAKAIVEALEEIDVPVDEEVIDLVRARYTVALLRDLKDTIDEETEHATTSAPAPLPAPPEQTQPDFERFHHPEEIRLLYMREVDLTANEIDHILSLPRETIVEDLERVLRDAVTRAALYSPDSPKPFGEDQSFFPFHALMFLAELKAAETLPAILEFLALHPDAFETWRNLFNATSTASCLVPILEADLAAGLESCLGWLAAPARPWKACISIITAAAQIVATRPEWLGETTDWFRRLSEAYLAADPAGNILDSRVVSELVSYVADLGLAPLLPQVRSLYEKQLVLTSIAGSWEEVETDTLNRPDAPLPDPIPEPFEIHGFYQDLDEELEAPLIGNDDDGQDAPDDDHDDIEDLEDLGIDITPPKPGRNDPCPCGSGKKFKKCCLPKYE